MRLSQCVLSSSRLLVAVLLSLCALSVPGATAVEGGDSGTIAECVMRADGTAVSLSCEQVMWRGKSGKSFAIKEWSENWPERPALLVVSTMPLEVEAYWSVDVTGTLATLIDTTSDGAQVAQRVLVVSPDSVQVYCDQRGRPLPCVAPKNLISPIYNKRPLTGFTTSQASMSIMSGELPPPPDMPDSPPPTPGSRDSLKWLPDGSPVTLNGAIVTAAFQDFFYVERSDRSFGIWVSSSQAVSVGELVDIAGQMATGGGERTIVPYLNGVTDADPGNSYPLPMAIGMNNRSLGGGAVGSFTPAVADSAGLNNTGMLVRTWGTVTNAYYVPNGTVYYVDDGSAVVADTDPWTGLECIGVKVYDPYSYLPTVGSHVTVDGVSAAETPDGAASSIRALWSTWPVAPATQPGAGTISGTVTAVGANGKTVRVYCGSASTTATFSGDTASYTLSVPYGNHAVTASLLGYRTTTRFASVNSGVPVDVDFTLPTLQRRIDVVVSPQRIPPDGVNQVTVTAIVRDEEGRRYANEAIAWDIDLGTVIGSDTTTDAVGEATATVQSSMNRETGTITAQSGNAVGYGYADYAYAEDPTIRILSPLPGENLSGTAMVSASAQDTDADGSTGLVGLRLYVDGVCFGGVSLGPERPSGVDTWELTNGAHTLLASATDDEGNVMWSQRVPVNVYNAVSEVQLSQCELFSDEPDPGSITISGRMNEADAWTLQVVDTDGNVVFTDSGGQGAFESTWDGQVAGSYIDGVYRVNLSAAGATRTKAVTISRGNAPVLITVNLSGEPDWSKDSAIDEVMAVMDACRARNLRFTILADPVWEATPARKGMSDYWLTRGYRYWFHNGHGGLESQKGRYYATVQLGGEFVYGNDYWEEPTYRDTVPAFSDVGILQTQYHIVMLNTCWSAGSYTLGYDLSIANAFGIYGAADDDQTYIGWSTGYRPGFPMNGTGWTKHFWNYLGVGYTVSQAEWWACYQGDAPMANFRYIYGGPEVTYLTW